MRASTSPVMLKIDQLDNVFIKEFIVMRDEKYLTDFFVKVGNDEIACHKFVLAAHSSYFQCMFKHTCTKDVMEGFVDLKPLNFAAVKLVIDFCYTGRMEFDLDEAMNIIEVIDYLQITPCIKSTISALIMNNVTVDNCIDWYFFTDLMKMPDIQQKAHEIMSMSFPSIAKSSQFCELEYNLFIDYISWEDVNRDCALVAACKWILYDIQQRHNKMDTILQAINIKQCSASCLKHVITEFGSQLINADYKQQFVDAILNDLPTWNEPEDGAGYDVIVLCGSDDKMVRKTWKLNLKTGATEEKAEFPTSLPDIFVPARCSTSTGAVFAGGMLRKVTSGYHDAITYFVHYRKAENQWNQLPSLPSPFSGAGAVCIREKNIFIFGGGQNTSGKMFCYNIAEMTWNPCPDMLEPLQYPIVGCVDDSIYVLHSTTAGNEHVRHGSEISLQCFNTTTSTWSFKASLPETIIDTCGASAVTIHHQLYVVGGLQRLCVQYNTLTDAWTVLVSCIEQHLCGAATLLMGKIVLCGGSSHEGPAKDTVELFDPELGTWTLLPVRLPQPLMHHHIIPRY